MKKILLSTAYFPPIEYLAAIVMADDVFIEMHETYFKQTYRTRCHIAAANGLQVLSVPVIKTNANNTPLQQLTLAGNENWQRVHWKSIESAYNKTPYFIHYRDELEEVLFRPYPGLLELNDQILKKILKFLRIDKSIYHTTEFNKTVSSAIDLRMLIHPKKNNLLPNSCHTEYFQAFSPKYSFLPNLSILDLLFAEGPHSINYLKALASGIEHQYYLPGGVNRGIQPEGD